MVTNRTSVFLAAVSLCTISLAQAQPSDTPSSYDFAFGSLALTELDSGGLEIGGSFSIAPQVYLFGWYQDWEVGEVVDRSILRLGGGYYWNISENLDLDVGAAIADSDLDRPGPFDLDDDGLILHAGLRGWATPVVELSSFIFLDDSLGSDVETVIEVGGQWFTRRNFSIGGRVRVDEDDTTLFFGARFYFRQ